MRDAIHPTYEESVVRCSCGNTFTTRSTKSELRVELCNECHPFYTGQQKFVDTGGRVQRFADKFNTSATAVLDRENAAKEARRVEAEKKAADEKSAREAKSAEKAARSAKFAKEAPAVEEVVAEDVVADVVEETVAEEAAE